jgi:hypothetical protein
MDIKLFGVKIRLELIILFVLLWIALGCHSCSKTKFVGYEGFTGANTNYGESSSYILNQPTNTKNWGTANLVVTPDTATWGMPNLSVTPGQPLSPGVKDFLSREAQSVPLPEDELLLFANTPFKPQCCPNAYSNSTGCACMTGKQYNYLIQRGGNNIPYSEY